MSVGIAAAVLATVQLPLACLNCDVVPKWVNILFSVIAYVITLVALLPLGLTVAGLGLVLVVVARCRWRDQMELPNRPTKVVTRGDRCEARHAPQL